MAQDGIILGAMWDYKGHHETSSDHKEHGWHWIVQYGIRLCKTTQDSTRHSGTIGLLSWDHLMRLQDLVVSVGPCQVKINAVIPFCKQREERKDT